MREVLVITALPEELEAVLDLRPNGRNDWNQHQIDEGYFYFECVIENGDEPFLLRVTSQAQQGPIHAMAHTTLMLRTRPDILFMTGICAGNKEEELKLGDIVISDMAFHYEVGKHVETGFKPEIENSNVDPVVVQWLNNYRAEKRKVIEFDGENHNLHVGAFATGSSVVSRKDIFSKLATRERKVLALDMEAYSFLKAVEISNQKMPAIVIKGVCDFADPDKDDKAHALAAKGSAVCMLEIANRLLPLLPDRTPDSKAVIYPIVLPRPAITHRDRLKWRALLQWPNNENWIYSAAKDFESGEYDESYEYSGLEFYDLGNKKWLLEVIVGYGAYNGTFRYYFLDESRAEYRWKEVLFRSFYWTEEGEIEEGSSPEIDGNAWFDPQMSQIRTFYKGRGIGDIGHLITYKFKNGHTTLVDYRHKFDNEKDPDDTEFYTDPNGWPTIDIDKRYPTWIGEEQR